MSLRDNKTYSSVCYCVNALSGLSCYCYLALVSIRYTSSCFNALTGLYLISTKVSEWTQQLQSKSCQCPLGLIPHFYQWKTPMCGNLWGVSMPSRADISFLLVSQYWLTDRYGFVSMPSRADISFLRYPFKNLGFMRFPEPVFAGIYQNILTTAVFRAC